MSRSPFHTPLEPLLLFVEPLVGRMAGRVQGAQPREVDSSFQLPIGNEPEKLPIGSETEEEVEVPMLGKLSAKHLGMPLFYHLDRACRRV